MRIKLSAEAAEEMLGAAEWYDQREPGLGADFLAACDLAFAEIASDPMRHPSRWKRLSPLFDAAIPLQNLLRTPGRFSDHRGCVPWGAKPERTP